MELICRYVMLNNNWRIKQWRLLFKTPSVIINISNVKSLNLSKFNGKMQRLLDRKTTLPISQIHRQYLIMYKKHYWKYWNHNHAFLAFPQLGKKIPITVAKLLLKTNKKRRFSICCLSFSRKDFQLRRVHGPWAIKWPHWVKV